MDPPPMDPPPTATDGDADGYPVDNDCDDADPQRHPGASEICGDAIDQDCDGTDCSSGADAGTAFSSDAGTFLALDAGGAPSARPPLHAGLEGGCSVASVAGPSARGWFVALLLGLGGLLLGRRRSARRAFGR